jgi:hypothetical protein
MNQQHVRIGGNSKLGSDIAVFDLPAGPTCIGASAWCAKFCYAKKAQRLYPEVDPFRARNLEFSNRDDFEFLVAEEIRATGARHVRIHSSGDFYSQAYLDKWIRAGHMLENTRLLAYTRAPLDFRAAPANMIIWWSRDPTTKDFKKPTGVDRIAWVSDDRAPSGIHTGDCWDHENNQHQKCANGCRWCWMAPNTGIVTFYKH